MSGDPFGNLRDWGVALDELRGQTEAGTLDQIQPGLVRLVRYPDNWRLRVHGLLAAERVQHPDPELLQALLEVVADDQTYTDARILAVRAVAKLVPRRAPAAVPDGLEADAVLRFLRKQLSVPEAPILQQALEQAIDMIVDRSSRTLA